MKILAFDTSTKFLSIACLEDSEVLSSYHEEVGIRHSEILVSKMKEIIKEPGWRKTDIDLVCTGLGPGSFTGLRIAVATIKGLAAVLSNKVVGVPTMDAIVKNVSGTQKRVAPLLNAYKGKVYSCIYERENDKVIRTTDYLLLPVEDLLDGLQDEVLFFGDAIEIYRDKLEEHPLAKYSCDLDWYPKAADIGRIGFERSLKGTDDPGSIDPLYLHAKECNIISRGS